MGLSESWAWGSLLGHVDEFMGEEPIAAGCAWVLATLGEGDVVANREGACADGVGGACGVGFIVDADVREVGTEPRLEVSAAHNIEGPPGGGQHLVNNRRCATARRRGAAMKLGGVRCPEELGRDAVGLVLGGVVGAADLDRCLLGRRCSRRRSLRW
ncbi:MAG TPA: hypothetical protein VIL92_10850 [Gaiellaceae bacterium]